MGICPVLEVAASCWVETLDLNTCAQYVMTVAAAEHHAAGKSNGAVPISFLQSHTDSHVTDCVTVRHECALMTPCSPSLLAVYEVGVAYFFVGLFLMSPQPISSSFTFWLPLTE